MSLTAAAHLAVLVCAVTFVALVAASAAVVVHVFRRWRTRVGLLRAVLRRTPRALPVGRVGAVLTGTLASPSWWLSQRDRHGMWRSVVSAEHAVTVAARAGAPVGDLPALTRRLHRAAAGLDAAMRAAGSDRGLLAGAAAERRRIEATAAQVRAAAVASLSATTADVQPVLSALSVELDAVAAGVRAARAVRLPVG